MMSGMPDHHVLTPPHPKKPRLDINPTRQYDINPASTQRLNQQWAPLKVDVNAVHSHAKIKGCADAQSSYLPETEAISPTLPNESLDSKSEIVSSISQVDKGINMVENQIKQLQSKQMKLEREAAKPKDTSSSSDGEKTTESRPLTLTQLVYNENRESATLSHNLLAEKFGDPTEFGIPLYNQPTDTPVYEKNRKHFTTFRAVLCQHFKRRAAERQRTERYLAETYQRLLTDWLKKVESEKTAKLTLKDQKSREIFEKIFPEIKKVREDREKFQSRGARGGSSGFARTEAEFDQIMEGINEKEQEERKMKAYAIIPQLLPTTDKHYKYMNENGLIREPVTLYKERKESRFWSQEEKDLFKEKYLERPKQFSHICEVFDKKSLNDCVLYYYMSKKSENYKQLLKKQIHKRLPKKLKDRMRNGPTITGSINPGRGHISDEEEMEFTRPAVIDPNSVCVCCNIKLEPGSTSYALMREQCTIYGLQEKDYQSNWRVCETCKARRDRIRNPICPIPTCNAVRRCKLRTFPPSWLEVTAELRDQAMKQLETTIDITHCCTKCYNKICQLINTPQHIILKDAEWTDTEIKLIQAAIRTHGNNWTLVASMIPNRTYKQCRKLYIRHKKQFALDTVLQEYKSHRASELGKPVSDNEDDLLEDNDLSSDDNMELSPPPSEHLHTDNLLRKEESSVKSELPKPMDVSIVKQEKEHDSSATASADEGPDIKPIPKIQVNEELVSKIKTEPQSGATDLSNNSFTYPSSWIPRTANQITSLRMPTNHLSSQHLTANQLAAQHRPTNPPSSPHRSANQTTSVKELIDHTIEDALNNQPSELNHNHRQSVINPPRSHPSASVNSTTMQRRWSPSPHSVFSSNNTATITTASHPNNPHLHNADNTQQVKRSLPPLPVKREFNMMEGPGHLPGMSAPYPDPFTRQPPPAHSNKSQKTTLATMFLDSGQFNQFNETHKMNQRPAHRDMKPNSQSQPLELKKEPHGDNSRQSRFEGGSISHGTPRSQHELNALNALNAVSQATERLSPRPARPAVAHSPARGQPSELERRMAEQQQQQILQMHFLQQMQSYGGQAGLFPPTFPGLLQPDFSSSNVLKDDFRTAHDMPHLVPGSTLDKLSPRTKELIPNPAANFGAMDPRFQASLRDYMRQQTPNTSQSNKVEDLQRSWPPRSTPSHNGPSHLNIHVSDAARLAPPSRPSLMSGVNKTLSPYPSHMNDRHHQVTQQHREPSISPHRSRYEMTKYEKDVSEINKMASGSDRSRYEPDSRSHAEPEPRPAHHYPRPHSSLPASMRDDIRPTNSSDHRPRSTDHHMASPAHRQDHHTNREPHLNRDPAPSLPNHQPSNRDHPHTAGLSNRDPHMTGLSNRDPHTAGLCNRDPHMTGLSNRDPHAAGLSNRDRHAVGLSNRDHHAAGLNRDPQNMEHHMAGLNVKHNDRRTLLEEDRKLLQSKQKTEQPERHHQQDNMRHRMHQSENRHVESHQSEASRYASNHQLEASRQFSSKKLAEVEKGIRTEQLHNDASALFSASFEKDPHEQIRYRRTETGDTLTAASLIDAIITQQINSESAAANQQTSVIVPLKKQRLAGSSPETDLTQTLSDGRAENRPMTLADRISDLINEGYAQPNKGDSTPKAADGRSSSPHRAVYRVDDVEPISPPSKNDSSSSSGTRQSPKSLHPAHSQPQKKNIRSLLGAGSPHTNSDPPRSTHEHANSSISIPVMDYVKNKIEEAIRQGFDKDPPPPKLPDKFNNSLPAYQKPGEGYNSSNQGGAKQGQPHLHQHRPVNRLNESDRPMKRTAQSGLEAMLKPPKPAHSHRAKSPEEVDLYNRIHNKPSNMRPGTSPKPATLERMKTPPSAGEQPNRPPSHGHMQRSTTPKTSHPNDSRQSPIDNSHRYSPLTQNLPDYRPTGLLKSLKSRNMYEPKHKHENSTGRPVLSSKYETLSDEDS